MREHQYKRYLTPKLHTYIQSIVNNMDALCTMYVSIQTQMPVMGGV